MKINLSVLLHAAADAASDACQNSGKLRKAEVLGIYQNHPTQLAEVGEAIKKLIEAVTGETVEIVKR